MKAYVLTTGAIFCLIIAVHVWRATEEGAGVARDPVYIVTTLAATGLLFWAWRVLSPGSSRP